MKRNMHRLREKNKSSRRETLPLLRGMFISPGAVRRFKNVSFSELLRDVFTQGDQQVYEYAGK